MRDELLVTADHPRQVADAARLAVAQGEDHRQARGIAERPGLHGEALEHPRRRLGGSQPLGLRKVQTEEVTGVGVAHDHHRTDIRTDLRTWIIRAPHSHFARDIWSPVSDCATAQAGLRRCPLPYHYKRRNHRFPVSSLLRHASTPKPDGNESPPDFAAALQVAAACGLIVAALIHFAVVDVHFEEWLATGVFFVVLGVVEIGLAVAVLGWGRRRIYRVALLVTVGTLALWVESRTLGVPVGPEAWKPEAVGRPDLISSVAEVLTGLLLFPIAAPPARARAVRSWLSRPLPVSTQFVVLAGLVALATWLASSGVQSARQEARAIADAERAAGRAAELNSRLVSPKQRSTGSYDAGVPDFHGH